MSPPTLLTNWVMILILVGALAAAGVAVLLARRRAKKQARGFDVEQRPPQ
jgi:hypothetical protein